MCCESTFRKMKQHEYGKTKPSKKSLQAQEQVPALNLVFAQKQRGTEVCLLYLDKFLHAK